MDNSDSEDDLFKNDSEDEVQWASFNDSKLRKTIRVTTVPVPVPESSAVEPVH
jgi:hypothetical protein